MNNEKLLGFTLIKIASAYMILGLLLGIGMGITQNFSLSSVHSHISLLGWLTMAVTGIIYTLLPGYTQGTLPKVHFWLHNIGLPIMMIGLAMFLLGYTQIMKVIASGSLLILIGLAAFAINLIIGGKPPVIGDR